MKVATNLMESAKDKREREALGLDLSDGIE